MAAPIATYLQPLTLSQGNWLYVLANVSPIRADQINLGLISLLALENSIIIYEPMDNQPSLAEDYTDYYADLVSAVATLKDPLLALGALAIHRSGLETPLFQPAQDLVFREADVRFDPRVWDDAALYVCINGLAVGSGFCVRTSLPPRR